MLDITKLEFEQVVDQLIIKLKEKENWKDVPITSTARTLIELYAYVMQLVMYYLKRTVEENFVDTAQFWSSLCRIANMLNLYVKRRRGAYGKIRVRAKSGSVSLSKYFQITIGGVPCYLLEDVVVGNEWKEVLIRQGERKSISFRVSNNDWDEFVIADENASDEDVVVKVGITEFEVVTDLFEGISDDRVRIYTKPDRSLAIQMFRSFGKPSVGNQVNVEYAVVDWEWFPSVSDSVYVSSEVEVELLIGTWVRGSDYESVKELRGRLVDMYRVGKRLVTKQDFEKVFLSLGEVEKVKVLDVKDEFKAPFRGVKVYVKLKDRWDLPQTFLDKVNEQVVGRIGLQGVKVDVLPVSKVDVDVYVRVNRKVGRSSVEVQGEVESYLRELYGKLGIGEWLSINQLRQEIMSLGYSWVVVILPGRDLELKENQLVNLRSVRVDVVEH